MQLDISLLPWQQEVWASEKPNHIIVAGRRCGKTEFAALRLIYNALTDGHDAHRFYVAPTQGQARKSLWKKLHSLGSKVIRSSHINNLEVTLVNGQVISLLGADRPEALRGPMLADLVIDEYADMKPYVLEEILMPACTDLDAPILLIGTPAGRNHFYDLYKEMEGGDDPDWDTWHFTSYDNPTLKTEVLDKRKKKMSSYAFRQEHMASFEAKGSEMFKEDWVKFDKKEPEGDYYIAVDLAGFEQVTKNKRLDSTAIAVVKVNTDGWWVKEIIYGRWDLNETANKIFNAVYEHQPVAVGIERGIAKQAVMSPLMDMMKRRNRFFRIEELTHGNQNKTNRVMWALQGRFENGYVTLNEGTWTEKFCDELYQFPDPLTHDDMIDALAYIDQLQKVMYNADIEYEDFEPLDDLIGY